MVTLINEKREALPRDDTLWLASHRDSSIRVANIFIVVNRQYSFIRLVTH